MTDLTEARLRAWSDRVGLPERIRFVAETGSTNADVKALAQGGAPHGTTLVAERQTAGRGRLGRTWESASGNLTLSVLVRPPALPIATVPLVSLAAAVAAASACGREYLIKWPNDVLHPGGEKVAGVLCEADSRGGAWAEWVIVGIGINVESAPDLPEAGALMELDGRDRDRAEMAARIVRDVLSEVEGLAKNPGDMFARWRERQCTFGRQVTVGAVTGEAIDIDPNGALQVRDANGRLHRVYAGDLHYAQGSGMPSILERLTREALEQARVAQAAREAASTAGVPPGETVAKPARKARKSKDQGKKHR